MTTKTYWVSSELFNNEDMFYYWLDSKSLSCWYEVILAGNRGLIIEVGNDLWLW